MRITNNTRTPYSLGGEAMLAPNAVTAVPDDVWAKHKNAVVVQGWLNNGWISDGGEKPNVDRAPTAMDERQQVIAETIRGLGSEDMMNDGRPKVDSINDNLPDDFDDVTASERDRVVDLMEENK